MEITSAFTALNICLPMYVSMFLSWFP